MRQLLTRVLGSRNERIIRGYARYVRAANQLEPQIKALSDEALREKTTEFRERLKGDVYYNLGRIREARSAYQNALSFGEDKPLVKSRLGLTEVRLGYLEEGFARLRRAVEEAPHQAELHDRLVKALLVAEDLSGAAEAAERLAGCFRHPKTFLRAASIRAQLEQWEISQKLLEDALELFPDSPALRDARAEVMRHRSDAGEPSKGNPNQVTG